MISYTQLTTVFFLTICSTFLQAEPYRIVAFGDFGEQDQSTQLLVRNSIQEYAIDHPLSLGFFLGDNFYPYGVSDVNDPQFQNKIVDIYEPLQIPFFAVLGNHDYGDTLHPGNVEAQVEFTDHPMNPIIDISGHSERLWHMPARFYTQRINPSLGADLEVFALDTELANPQAKLDGTGVSWKHQMEDLEAALYSSTAKWKIVIGHHPIVSDYQRVDNESYQQRTNMKLLKNLIIKYAHAYIAGHDHSLQVLPLRGYRCSNQRYREPLQVISGAAGNHDLIQKFSKNNSIFKGNDNAIGFIVLEVKDNSLDFIPVQVEDEAPIEKDRISIDINGHIIEQHHSLDIRHHSLFDPHHSSEQLFLYDQLC